MKAISFLATVGIAVLPVVAAFEFPDSVPIHARQTEGPKYECHVACGGVITEGRKEGHCESEVFTSHLETCLECANEHDIWKHYGDTVSGNAQGCGLPSEPEGASSSSGSATSSISSAASKPTTLPGPKEGDKDEEPQEEGEATATEDDDSSASQLTSVGSVMLFGMLAAAGLM